MISRDGFTNENLIFDTKLNASTGFGTPSCNYKLKPSVDIKVFVGLIVFSVFKNRHKNKIGIQ